jgi:hypothetical protein
MWKLTEREWREISELATKAAEHLASAANAEGEK